MEGALHTPFSDAKVIYGWYQKAQVDYVDMFIKMYITYNAWYREVVGTLNDRQAIGSLKKRYVIWDDYVNGQTMRTLRPYMERLAELTAREPLMSETSYWEGSLQHANDWRSLIEFWYQVRCRLVHGSEVERKYVWLAYETLDVFMGEIVDRMQKCITDEDRRSIRQLGELARSGENRDEKFKNLQNRLYKKYVASPDIWQVDMKRVQSEDLH